MIDLPKPWQERISAIPPNDELWISIIMLRVNELKSSNVLSRNRDSRHSKSEDLGNRNIKKVPCGGIVSCPEASKTVTADKASSSDNEVASVLSPAQLWTEFVEILKTMIGSFVQVVAIQRPDLNRLPLLGSIWVTRPAIRVKVQPKR